MEQTQWRPKKEINVRQDTLKKAQSIADDFKLFTDGYRVLMAIHRPKEGGKNNGKAYVSKKLVKNYDEYVEALYDLLIEKATSDRQLRIYAHCNSRDMDKGIRLFKHEQLDADSFDDSSLYHFYEDIRNRFISCLSEPSARYTGYFILDLDVKDDTELLKAIFELNIDVVKKYPTKNGWHFITRAFNPNLLKVDQCEVKRDGLMLLDW